MTGSAASDRRGLVAVARVARAHGIRGEVSMDSHADSPLLFAAGRTLFLALAPAPGKAAGRPRPYVVRSSRDNNGRLLVALEGVFDRDAAESLRGAEVLAPAAELPPPDEGEEYLHRLLGAQVFLEDGSEVGVFEAILDTPGQLTWVIRAPGAKGKAGAEILFPAVPEFILGLDADAGEIVIDPPPGLLELYLSAPPDAPERPQRPPRPPRPAQAKRPGSGRAKAAARGKAGKPGPAGK